MNLLEYAASFKEAEADFERSVEERGLPFEAAETSPRSERGRVAAACGCHCENGGFSLWRKWISPACLACRTGERTGSLFVDLRCTKDCYFCFNANQPHYEHFRRHGRDIALELEQAHAAGARYDCLAVTGGEPLLNLPAVVAFLKRAGELYPEAHTRLYTNGDLVDADALAQLAAAGLREIRFSVKPADFDDSQEDVLQAMELAVAAIPDVLVEMPVIPGTREFMEGLMLRADAMGVRCINLLEFCFPLHNAGEFARRGFKLRKRPRKYTYDYWYSGGVPVAGSEADALALMEFAAERGLAMGVHYCSADNRNSAQVHAQNRPFSGDADMREALPWMDLADDNFIKCAKAFGDDAERVLSWLDAHPNVPRHVDESVPSVAFPRARIDAVRAALPGVELGECAYIIEEGAKGAPARVREVAVREAG